MLFARMQGRVEKPALAGGAKCGPLLDPTRKLSISTAASLVAALGTGRSGEPQWQPASQPPLAPSSVWPFGTALVWA